MDFGKSYLEGKPLRKRDKIVLNKLRSRGVSSTVFVMDLEDAILKGDSKISEEEAAKLFILADSPQAILESVVNLVLHDYETYGIFSYHLLRAIAFGKVSKEEAWTFIQCILQQVKSVNFTPRQQNVSLELEIYFGNILKSNSKIMINQFNTAYRLYHSNYVRTESFRISITDWLVSKKLNNSSIKKSAINSEAFIAYQKSGGIYFVKKAESIITKTQNKFEIGKKLVFLDSLRMMCRNFPKPVLGLIEQKVNRI